MIKILLLFVSILVLTQSQKSEGDRKSQSLRYKSYYKSNNGVIEMSQEEYLYYVEESPRPYNIVLFLSGFQCQFCQKVEKDFEKVASTYRESGGFIPQPENKRHATYFVKIMFSNEVKEVFLRYGISQVPYVVVSPPKMTLKLKDNLEFESYIKTNKWHITSSTSHGFFTVDKLLNYINDRTKWNIQIQPPLSDLVLQVFILLSLLGVFSLVFWLMLPVFLSPKIWFFVSIVTTIICLSGLVYNIQHNSPWYGTNQDGSIQWVAKGQRQQYIAEGYFFSGGAMLFGLIMVLIFYLSEGKFRGSEMLFLILLFIAYQSYNKWHEFIKQKVYSNPVYFPPSYYKKGHWSVDQGRNI